MKKIKTCLMLVTLISVAAPPLESSPAYGDRIVAGASINLLNGPQSNYSFQPDSSVSAAAQWGRARSSARANTSPSLAAQAYSSEIGLSYPSTGDATFSSIFRNYRSSLGTYIPPGTSFNLLGKLTASSEPGNWGSVALARYSYILDASDGRRSGAVTLGSQGGIPVLLGGVSPSGKLIARIQPKINLSGSIPLVENDFIELGIDFDLWEISLGEFQTTNFRTVAALIAQAIFNLGLPRLEVPPRRVLSVGFDVDLKIEFADQNKIVINLPSSGIAVLFAHIQCSASTSRGAIAESTFDLSPAGR